MAGKTYSQKLCDSKDMPKIVVVEDPKAIAGFGGEKMLIAPPLAYDEIMKRIPHGFVTTSDRIRAYLANRQGADYTCHLTSGIFINIAAHASSERAGVDETPCWRTLKKDGELNEKYPGGIEGQKQILEKEGHKVIQKGKRFFLEGYEDKLYKF